MSGRMEKFKEIRQIRRKYAISILLFMSLLLSGIFAADFSINNLMNNEKGIRIVSVKPVKGSERSCYEVWRMDRKYIIDMTYINRDIQRAKEFLDSLTS